MKLVATKALRYARAHYAVGEEFDARGNEAKVLIALRWATKVEDAAEEVKVKRQYRRRDLTADKPKRQYRRRDMQAEG